ncbi:MAG TPA: hypothetical protein DCQ04_00175 [Actinobacteria bacterium]|nr:hypothetical protein [Actinomycetota bacterium]
MAFASLRLHGVRVVVSNDAQTAADAMRLAHDGGVEGGFLRPRASGMRFNPTFLNPGTEFVVAYADDQPIASLVLTPDGPFGLPSDRAFVEELDGFRAADDVLFEAGAWVITPEWRRHTMFLGAFLFAPAMRIHIAAGDNRRMCVVVEPNRINMVSGIFGYELICGPRPYLGLPGTLLVTRPSREWAEHFMDTSASAPRRIVADHVFDPEPGWLQVGREGEHWTHELLPTLLPESDVQERLAAQLEILEVSSVPLRQFEPSPIVR